MKKFFLCAALIACSGIVCAQVKTPPSFRNYLHNKKSIHQLNSRVFNLSGKGDIGINALTIGNNLNIAELKKFLNHKDRRSALYSQTLAGILPNGNKLILLPQDNMPCVVPDLSPFNMPVAKGNNELDKRINVVNP